VGTGKKLGGVKGGGPLKGTTGKGGTKGKKGAKLGTTAAGKESGDMGVWKGRLEGGVVSRVQNLEGDRGGAASHKGFEEKWGEKKGKK